MRSLPNILSASRGIAALAMLFFPLISPWFWILYCWGGISDMIDGPIARKMKAQSELGSRIDSIADLMFVICSAVVIIPLMDLSTWIWLWTVAIGLIKIVSFVLGSCRRRKLNIPHSISNRLTGILLFFLPLALVLSDDFIPSVIVCSMATFSILEDMIYIHTSHKDKELIALHGGFSISSFSGATKHTWLGGEVTPKSWTDYYLDCY